MNGNARTEAPRPSRFGAVFASVVAFGALGAFILGLWSGGRSHGPAPAGRELGVPEAAPVAVAPPSRHGALSSASLAPTSLGAREAGELPVPAPVAPGAAPLLTPQGRPTPALVARVTDDARRALEEARTGLLARCAPAGHRARARLTFNVTFDASGREIARGIAEDRTARAPEVASCLRKLPLGSLRVAAPGTSVGVRVALNLR